MVFLDSCLSPRLRDIMKLAGIDATHLNDTLPLDVCDPTWMQKAADEGWPCLTKDDGITTRAREYAMLRAAGISVAVLRCGEHATLREQAAFILLWWPRIDCELRRQERGIVLRLCTAVHQPRLERLDDYGTLVRVTTSYHI